MLFCYVVPILMISSSGMETLEGQPITLNCSASEDHVVVKWLFNGTEIALDDERYIFSPPGLNNILTIINPNTSESGNYSCRINITSPIEDDDDTIPIMVLPGNCLSMSIIMYIHITSKYTYYDLCNIFKHISLFIYIDFCLYQ